MLFPDFSQLSVEVIFFASLAFALICKISLLFFRYSKLAFYKARTDNTFNKPVSVVICARNEGENLTKFLPEILTQDYHEFEVVVVNDCSYDNTDDVLREFAKVFPNLKAITVKEDEYYKHGKKFALLVGIKGAKYEHLVLTDADCKPASSLWLKKMASGFSNGKEIVLGYGAYFQEKGFLNKLIRYDTFLIGLKYLSAALRKKPYMGVGRNLAYTKDLFFRSKNFSKHYHLISGDDDLFINQVATADNTTIVIDHEAITYSEPKHSLKNWKMQKGRHLTTAPYYKQSTKMMLGIDIFVNFIFWIFAITCLVLESTRISSGIGFILIIFSEYLILIKVSKQLNEKNLVSFYPILNIFLILLYPIFHLNK
ncbi:MAG: glycosyltransferase, partial [Bacteroidota bacterium]